MSIRAKRQLDREAVDRVFNELHTDGRMGYMCQEAPIVFSRSKWFGGQVKPKGA